ncbi:diguanylate cyclase [Desulfurobacterium atlanticum]|uniref:diguanylate cyclase n=1 Tax=Desulfurobacterium atlanticum TaxID=240169 RepID=A0A238Z6N9_9BACT|nr:diguanylate cyclase [Desulfurobacterium atlanticum]SNR79145.1 diguanylate cyclase (GGDEF) domain-containing protein [Desulfurobacterium atlanticum]
MKIDLSQPIEIADDIFWIGYVVPNDPFQCHVYLIRNGSESVLIDPGSMITFPVVLEKIFKLTTLDKIKYIIFHHQDPDIVGCFSTLETLFPKGERYIVTHWRAEVLLKHYRWKTPFYLVDKNDWQLKAGDRELEFIFTPYAHFPGAFCTFDKKTETLFSSDIFGAITDEFMLFAEDVEEYYAGVELFHKHYMPSKVVLNYVLEKIEKVNPEIIAPQHGSVIRKEMIPKIMERLKSLDCGLYLLDKEESDIFVLNRLDEILKSLFRSIISSSDFSVVMKNLFLSVKQEIPFLVKIKLEGLVDRERRFIVDVREDIIKERIVENVKRENEKGKCAFTEALETDKGKVGELIFYTDKLLSEDDKKFVSLLIKHVKYALAASFEKEIEKKLIEMENRKLLEKVSLDPLTQLFNRGYLYNFLHRAIKGFIKNGFPVSAAIIDIDYFKLVNDTHGHLVGDVVLKGLADMMRREFRSTDCIIRYGGEEFVVVMPFTDLKRACLKMENFRRKVENKILYKEKGLKITISVGVSQYKKGMTIKEFLEKIDSNLYKAKRSGRNRVICG